MPFELPGGFRVGLDGFLGLIPGIGDLLGASASTWIVIRAAQLGASTATLVRMMWNIILETIVGAVPVLGDLFDFAWKANDRNIRLLENQSDRAIAAGGAGNRLKAATIALLVGFAIILVALIAGIFKLLLILINASGAG